MKFAATPYDMDKDFFYFETLEEFHEKAEASGAEEFEIEFVDGEPYEAQMADAWGLSQANVGQFIDYIENDSESDMPLVYYLLTRCGYTPEGIDLVRPDLTTDCVVYWCGSAWEQSAIREFTDYMIYDCEYLGPVSDQLAPYIDEKAVWMGSLRHEFAFVEFGGTGYMILEA